jgi:AraC-like DNA-binding protein
VAKPPSLDELRLAPATREELFRSPIGRYVAGRTYLVGVWDARLRLGAIFGRPDENDMRELASLLEVAFADGMASRLLALTDLSLVEAVDVKPLAVLEALLAERRAAFASKIERQALVRPASGLVGLVVAGFSAARERPGQEQTFTRRDAALDWLGHPDGKEVASAMTRLLHEVAGVNAALSAFRRNLEMDPGLGLEALAARQGMSKRSLQRMLQASNTSYQKELPDAQLRAAQRLLVLGHKVDAVASEVGCRADTLQRLFRERLGKTPSEFRADAWARKKREP